MFQHSSVQVDKMFFDYEKYNFKNHKWDQVSEYMEILTLIFPPLQITYKFVFHLLFNGKLI